MKAVLMSVQPKWCEKKASGKKTIEVRKARPKVETPFKCYIYCTKLDRVNLNDYICLYRNTCGRIDYWHGKVIGEFICDRIYEYKHFSNLPTFNEMGLPNGYRSSYLIFEEDYKAMCLSYDEVKKYGNGKTLYGWHISDLKIYEEPRWLDEFRTLSMCSNAKYVEIDRSWYCTEENEECSYFDCARVDCGSSGVEEYAYCLCDGHKPLTRPPQSWCYVEELEE